MNAGRTYTACRRTAFYLSVALALWAQVFLGAMQTRAQDRTRIVDMLPASSRTFVRSMDPTLRFNQRAMPNGRVDTDSGVLRAAYRIQAHAPASATPEVSARDWLHEHRARFGWDSADELALVDEIHTPYSTHLTFQQTYHGLPVHSRRVKVNLDAQRRPTMVLSGYAPNLRNTGAFDATPVLTAEEARALAEQMVSTGAAMAIDPELVVYPLENPLLAWRVISWPVGAAGEWEVLLDARTGAVVHLIDRALRNRPDDDPLAPRMVDGKGKVWIPDPITSAGVPYGGNYVDGDDADSDALNNERVEVTLRDIEQGTDGKYRLKGPYVQIDGTVGVAYTPPVGDTATDFDFLRADPHFEAVQVYYHIDYSQRYVQSLNIGRDVQINGVLANPHGLGLAPYAAFYPTLNHIYFGDGGVDTGEDAEVIWHEYGHALLEGTSVDMWASNEGSVFHEGWSDYWAASYTRGLMEAGTVPAGDWRRVFDWNGNETWSGRRLESTGVYPDDFTCVGYGQHCEEYKDGVIWGTTLMEIYTALGKALADRLNLISHGYLSHPVTLPDAAEALLQADHDHYQGAHNDALSLVLGARGFITVFLLPPIADLQFEVGVPIVDVELPAAVGGTGPYRYALSPALPAGLEFDEASRTVSGTPTQNKQPISYTYTATDAAQATTSRNFTIEVTGTGFVLPDVPDQIYVYERAIAPLVLPGATGTTGPYAYALSPPLPAGLAIDWDSRTISGTPTEAIGPREYTYSATDNAGLVATRAFDISVQLALAEIEDQVFYVGREVPGVTLPVAEGGVSPYTYALVPELPQELAFDEHIPSIYGTPVVSLDETDYTFSGTGEAGATRARTFSITVEEIFLPVISDLHFVAGRAIPDLILPAASGRTGPFAYSLSPALPSGLAYDAQTRAISGTPSAESSPENYTYAAADGFGNAASRTFLMEVHAALALPPVADREYTVGEESMPVVLPAATGGLGPPAYSLTPVPPPGLEFNTQTRTLSGTPSVESGPVSYTYAATDTTGTSVHQQFEIVVQGALFMASIADQRFEYGQPIQPLVLPAASGGTAPYTYALTPALPAGLQFDAATRTVSGTPSEATAPAQYTYEAADSSGLATSRMFIVEVQLAMAPVNDQIYTAGKMQADLVLPAASGGTAPYAYALTPDLPEGLRFDVAMRAISGTPVVATAREPYSYEGTDASGLARSRTFHLEVQLALAPIADQEYIAGEAIVSLVLPAAMGGSEPYMYELSPPLPAGLHFDSASRMLSGTPQAVAASAAYTYAATDAAGLVAARQFNIEILLALSLPPVPDAVFVADQEITPLVLPVAAGGRGPFLYSLRPDPPPGLVFDSLSRTLRGTPTTAMAADYTYTAEDAGGRTVAQEFNIEVLAALQLPAVADQRYTIDVEIDPLVLPAATGGRRPYVYTLSPDVPDGLVYDAMTRTMSGSPSAVMSPRAYSYAVADAFGLTATQTFEITVGASEALIRDRAALIALYDAAGGAMWTNNSHWLDPPIDSVAFVPEALDAWFGVSMAGGRVVALELPQNNLRGTVPAQLGDLSELALLQLGGNGLEGAMPSTLGQLDSLRGLFLNDNMLAGAIPSVLGRLHALEVLHLHHNALTASIPDSLGSLPRLRELHLHGNALAGSMPHTLGRLARLERLQLEDNRLTGTLPDSLGQLAALEHLRVHNNALSGALPSTMLQLTALRELSFGGDDQTVCAPLTAAFGAWLALLEVVSGPDCGAIRLPFAEPLSDQRYTVGTKIPPLVLPEATGGALPYRYSLDPGLPPGLIYDDAVRTVRGTPEEAIASTTFTYDAVDAVGRKGALTFTITVAPVMKDGLVVHGNFPNPFSAQTHLEVSLAGDAEVGVAVYDLTGRRVALQSPARIKAGVRRQIVIRVPALAPGIYLYQLMVAMEPQTLVRAGRMVILR